MKLSRLYSNQSNKFPAISFNPGLNVVLAETREPDNLKVNTHNLGKTTLAALIDFCLLKGKNKEFFLFKHDKLFHNFEFYLELQLDGGEFVTIRRPVSEATKISFRYSSASMEDLSKLSDEEWDHWCISFDRSIEILDGLLNFSVAKKWSFRHPIGYALRLQDDYQDVFQLKKFSRGRDVGWKPFVAELIGLDGQLTQDVYDLAGEIEDVRTKAEKLELQLSEFDSPDKLNGMIMNQKEEVDALDEYLKDFDFNIPEKEISESLVQEIETSIAAYNKQRYHLEMALETIVTTLGTSIKFNLNKVESVFNDAKIYFGEQLKNDYNDLLEFLKSISEERAKLLKEERARIETELDDISEQLEELNNRRVKALEILREAETLKKYRRHSDRLSALKVKLQYLEEQKSRMQDLSGLRKQIRMLEKQREDNVNTIAEQLNETAEIESTYKRIRREFGSIIKSVLNSKAVLSTKPNNLGNIVFNAEILDATDTATSADKGKSYKKFLCIAFDIAIFSAYLGENFLHFIYHDGVFEALDDRMKIRLLDELRSHCDAGLQQIITLIDSDLPIVNGGNRFAFEEDEVILRLHDQGDDGRLFKMPSW